MVWARCISGWRGDSRCEILRPLTLQVWFWGLRMRVLRVAGFLLMLWGLGTAMAQQAPATPAAGTQATATATPAVSPLDVPLPADPMQRLELASKVNGLEAADIHPWHLKASYEIQDPEGKPLDKGTFEEWWAGPKRYKVIYHGQDFLQTEYGTEKGVFREGDAQIPPFLLEALRSIIGRPVPSVNESAQGDTQLQGQDRHFGNAQLACTAFGFKGRKRVDSRYASYCFGSSNAVLRYANSYANVEQVLFNNESVFSDRYVAKEIVLLFLGHSRLSVHIGTLEPIDMSDPIFATVPEDAALIPARVVMVFPTLDAISKAFPRYPIEAKETRTQGAVLMSATITTGGRVTNIQVLAGPKVLQAAAVDAIRQWRYKPILLGGQPVEVDLTLQILFTLDG